ncbi:unnamed protein product [Closterium sp. NIES-53]
MFQTRENMTDFTRASHQPLTAACRSTRRRSTHRVTLVCDDLQLFLQCDRADGLSLFDLTSGASPAPPATADSTVCSQWATHDAAAHLAVRRQLPTTERAHFSQYKSAQTLYDAVVARYSSPATAALSRLMLPYLFPDLVAFPTVADLITHLRTSDTRYRAALPADVLTRGDGGGGGSGGGGGGVGVSSGGRGGGGGAGWSGGGGGGGGGGGNGGAGRGSAQRSGAGVAIFDLDYDAILAAMYAVCDSVEDDCYLCVPPDPGIEATALGTGEAAALGASASAASDATESALLGTTSA